MLIDEAHITVRAGHGGPGKVSFDGRGPDGGNGGDGGNVYITVTSDLTALNQFSAKQDVTAPDGEPGTKRRSHGKNGADLILRLPIGTTLIDKDVTESIELTNLDQNILLCKGGMGGRGNFEFKSSKNRSPEYAQPGRAGEYKKFKVTLRFIADFGLVGFPNAGKSSLLNVLTNAKVAVGAYPFTTLEANLGALSQKIIADIPGLIEGASKGKGLGTNFLKHIEKVKLLLHCISAESTDVASDYITISQELEKFNPDLLAKPRIILLTKTDLANPGALAEATQKLSAFDHPIFPVSIYDPDSISKLKTLLTHSS